MNQVQTEVIFLNLLRQADEFVYSILGMNPTPDAGSFRARVSALFEMFKANKYNFVLSPVHLGFLATLIKEYDAFRKSEITQIGTPEVLIGQIRWEDIYDKPDILAASADWADITNKPATFPPATHAHAYSEITDKPATFPPSPHEHPEYAGGGATWNTLADKPATFPPSPHEHPQYALAGSGGGGGAIVRTWVGNETTGAWFNFPATFVPQAMLIYEYEHGFRGLWTTDVTPYIMYDDGTADEFTLQATGFTFPPGILCCKQDKWYYAILWS